VSDLLRRKLSFKAGFLSKLASDGVLPSALFGQVKSAGGDLAMRLLSGAYGEGRGLLGTAAGAALPTAKLVALLGAGIPMAMGGVTGTLSSKLNSPPEPDIEAMRKQEMIQLYKRLTNEVQSRRQLRESGV
jgi:hypothetical protein